MTNDELTELYKRGIEDIIANTTATVKLRVQANKLFRARMCPLRAKMLNDADHRRRADEAATKANETDT